MPATAVHSRAGHAALTLAFCLGAVFGPREVSAATARVQYVSAASVYLDAGRAAGLIEGASVTVTRSGKEIARLTVVFVAEHSTACHVESSVEDVRAGDTAAFSPAAAQDSSAAPAGGSSPDSSKAAAAGPAGARGDLWPSSGHVHGRIASFYTRTSDPGGAYENPSLLGDLRWSGKALEQTTVHVRATRPSIRTASDLSGASAREVKLRVYEVSAGYRSPGGRLDMEAGRILPRRLEGIGYVDGAAIHWHVRPALGAGLTGGRGANLAIAGLASRGLQLGGYLEAGSRAGLAAHRWHAMLAGMFSRDSVLTSRQYVLERADYTPGGGTSFYQSVEADLNPRWKQSYGEPALGWTAWSLGSSVSVRRGVVLALSADSRRAVLLPAQVQVSAPIALDRFTGAHASLRFALPRECALRVGGDLRRRERDAEIFSSWDAGLTANKLAMKSLSGGLHAMGFTADHFRGVNGDASLLARVGPWAQIDLAGGVGGTSTLDAAAAPSYRSRWLRSGIDYRGPGGLWAVLSHEWHSGGPGRELAAELGLSF